MKKILTICMVIVIMTIPLTSFKPVERVLPKQVQVFQPEFTDFIEIGLTYYNPVISQCDADPLVTASMSKIDTTRTTSLHWCAISFDMHVRYGGFLKFGDTISLEIKKRNGKIVVENYIVKDLMNPKLRKRVDILCAVGECGIPSENVKMKNSKIISYKRLLAEKEEKKKQKERIDEFSSALKIKFEGHSQLKNDFFYKKTRGLV